MCKTFNFFQKQLKKIEDYCASINYNNCKIISKKRNTSYFNSNDEL